ETRAEHRTEIGFEVVLHATKRGRHAFEQPPGNLVDADGFHKAHLEGALLPRIDARAGPPAPKQCARGLTLRASRGNFIRNNHGTEAALCLRASPAYAR